MRLPCWAGAPVFPSELDSGYNLNFLTYVHLTCIPVAVFLLLGHIPSNRWIYILLWQMFWMKLQMLQYQCQSDVNLIISFFNSYSGSGIQWRRQICAFERSRVWCWFLCRPKGFQPQTEYNIRSSKNHQHQMKKEKVSEGNNESTTHRNASLGQNTLLPLLLAHRSNR